MNEDLKEDFIKEVHAAAMREALMEIETVAGEAVKNGTMELPQYSKIVDIAEEALSAPARNCDRFADAESARQAWLDDADNWDDFGSPKLELHEWLFAQEAERKGEAE